MTDYKNQDVKKSMRPGEAFLVEFEEAASAGYLWSAEGPPGIELKKTTVPAQRGIGTFNKVSYFTTIDKPGNYDFTFTHKRPFEDKPERTVRYTLSVQP